MSDRAIAAEIGVGKDTVRRARGGAHAPPAKRKGKDGKDGKDTGGGTQPPAPSHLRGARAQDGKGATGSEKSHRRNVIGRGVVQVPKP